MNQSKSAYLDGFIFFAACIYTLFIIAGVSPIFPQGGDMGIFAVDSWYTYAPQIDGKIPVDNWHSQLFMYECIAFRRFFSLLCGYSFQAREILAAAWYVSVMIIFLNAFFWIVSYAKNRVAYVLSICVVSFICSVAAQDMIITLDIFFMAVFFSCFSICIILRKVKQRQFMWFLVLLVLLVHVVAFRRNAVLVVPAFLFYGMSYCPSVHVSFPKRIVAVCVLCCVVWLASGNVVQWILPVKERFPLSPMMESDIRIAALLRGEEDRAKERLMACGYDYSSSPYRKQLAAYANGDWFDGENVHPKSISHLYLNEWKENFSSMLMSRMIQIVRFYSGNELISPIRSTISMLFPRIGNKSEAFSKLPHAPKKIWFFRQLLLLFCIAMALINVWKRMRWIDDVLFLMSVSFSLYALSFIIVTPTADFRYISPCVFGSAILIVLFALHAVCRKNTSV